LPEANITSEAYKEKKMIRKHSNQDSLAYKALMPIVKKAAVTKEFPAKIEVYGKGNAINTTTYLAGYSFILGLSVIVDGRETNINLDHTDFSELYNAVKASMANPRV